MKMKRFHWALSALVLGIPIRASAKCGGVNYSWGADALASMHDYVVTMMLYVLYLLYAIAAIVAVISALQIYIKPKFGIRLCHKVYGVTRYDTSSLHMGEWLSVFCKKQKESLIG